ncbi:MAG: cytochrome PufQ [Rhodobacteraceae bacterium]|nr:cytochrome PufQ [Paracoccaceae bacterium]
MSDFTQKHRGKGRSSGITEYRVYYGIIFTLAIPFAAYFWFRDLLRGDIAALHHGIVGRALSEANVTTPKIFSAY